MSFESTPCCAAAALKLATQSATRVLERIGMEAAPGGTVAGFYASRRRLLWAGWHRRPKLLNMNQKKIVAHFRDARQPRFMQVQNRGPSPQRRTLTVASSEAP